MQTAYLVVIVHENGTIWVHSVHGTMQSAETTQETLRAENRKENGELQFDYCHIVARPFYL